MKVPIRRTTLALSFVLVAAVAATAQDSDPAPPPLDVAVEYAYMTEQYLDRQLPAGWVVSVQRHISDRWALVGEGNGAYWGMEAFPDFFPYAAWVHSILGGPRLKMHVTPKTTVFAQALAGWVRRTRTNPGSIIAPENEGNIDTVGLQPGVGVDYRIDRRFAIRVNGDYRWLKETSVTQRNTNESRIAAGVVIGVERRP